MESMKRTKVPQNPYQLTSAELTTVKAELLALMQDPMVEPKDKVYAARELNRFYEFTRKNVDARPADVKTAPPVDDDCPLQGLKVVG